MYGSSHAALTVGELLLMKGFLFIQLIIGCSLNGGRCEVSCLYNKD